ncbi:MAG TPA: PKD domain-containing protein [Vicinamibacterales bacterium]|nr:PKD domain-containing protein [Vicinamibacterales bacterium]
MIALFSRVPAAGRRAGAAACLLAVTALAASCDKVPLLAPSGSTITLTSANNVLPVGGTTQVVAQVIEPSGTPPHQGTQVTFTTTLGTIRPDQVETDASGRAVAVFIGDANGTATITAISGGASASGNSAVRILVGTAGVGGVRVSANPSQIPAFGGVSTISAAVFDVNGNALGSAPVVFTTSAGNLSVSVVNTNTGGIAQTQLSTTTQATVTATVGAQGGGGTGAGGATGATGSTGSTTPTTGQTSGTVTVSVLAAPTLVITPPTSAPQSGLPASFSFVVTPAANGSPVTNLAIDWGDGTGTENKGAVTGTSVQSHVYRSAGTYTITATLTDSSGNTIQQQASITVIPLAPPTIVITQSPLPGKIGATTNITIQVTVPQGLALTHETVEFGDGTSADLGGGSTNITIPHQYNTTGTFNVTVNVTDTSGTTTQARGTVQIST